MAMNRWLANGAVIPDVLPWRVQYATESFSRRTHCSSDSPTVFLLVQGTGLRDTCCPLSQE